MSNRYLDQLRAELRAGDPMCRYVTIERNSIELMLARQSDNLAHLAVTSELLRRAHAELLRAWKPDENHLQPYQEAALRSINECLSGSHGVIRRYRHRVRSEYVASLRELLTRTVSALAEDAKRERQLGRKPIAETIENMGEGLSLVTDCLGGLLSQFLARESIITETKALDGTGTNMISL